MSHLSNVSIELDLERRKKHFENPAFRGVKALVTPGTALFTPRRTGRFKIYTPNVLVHVVARTRILALVRRV